MQKGLQYEIFSEFMCRLSSREKELAESRGSELIVYREPSEANEAHATANARLQRLRANGFVAVDVVQDAEFLQGMASVRD